VLVATLAATSIPPGRAIYNMLNVPDTDYLVINFIPATPLAISVINGAIYGVIVWLVFSLAMMFTKKKPTKPV